MRLNGILRTFVEREWLKTDEYKLGLVVHNI